MQIFERERSRRVTATWVFRLGVMRDELWHATCLVVLLKDFREGGCSFSLNHRTGFEAAALPPSPGTCNAKVSMTNVR